MVQQRDVARLLAAAALTFALGACGSADGSAGTPAADETGTAAETGEMADMEMAQEQPSGASEADGQGHDDHGEAPEAPAPDAREIEIEADSFAYDPAELRIGAGEEVALDLTSSDLLHDFTIDEVDFHMAAEPGETATGGLSIDEPGTYTAYCTVAGHREAGMEATVIVE